MEMRTKWEAPEGGGAPLLTMGNIARPLHLLAPRTIMGMTSWNKMRKECYEACDYTCEACGTKCEKGKCHSHEMYDVDYENCIARFNRVVGLCPICHVGFIHSGRALTCYRNHIPLWTKDYMLTNAEHGFKLIDDWNRKHPNDEPLKVWATIKRWLEEPSLHGELRELIDQYHIEFWGAKNNEGENGTWNKWKLVYNDTEYYSPYEDRAAYEAKMEENNSDPKNRPKDLFQGEEFEILRRNINASMPKPTQVEGA